MNGVDKITEKILSEAREAEKAALAHAQKRAEEILAVAEAEADAIRNRIADAAAREGEEIVSRAKAAASMHRRRAELALRAELIDEVFDEAFAAISALPREEYRQLLCQLLCDALSDHLESLAQSVSLHGDEVEMPAFYEIQLNADDHRAIGKALLADARRALKGRAARSELDKLTLSAQTVPISGGLILQCGDVCCNCSLETLFARARVEHEADVANLLFG